MAPFNQIAFPKTKEKIMKTMKSYWIQPSWVVLHIHQSLAVLYFRRAEKNSPYLGSPLGDGAEPTHHFQ